LKKHYRDLLREGNPNLSFIYLKGDFDVIESRLKARKGHFFKTYFLSSSLPRIIPRFIYSNSIVFTKDRVMPNVQEKQLRWYNIA
ncbi:hypothetical protein MJN51_32460, partial [Salmonella enterica subsp. enterica serovar Kentucky]|nr:hypothetical protein [Salmonella enterica subsp. enterica serovar Kentucky]